MKITNSIKTRFLLLSTYANYIENGGYLTYDNNKIIDREGVGVILKLPYPTVTSTLKIMIDNNLLQKDKIGYKINGDISIRGKLSKSEDLKCHTRIFDEGFRSLYNGCTPKQHKQLYYLFKLLPYISLKFNAICSNPDEEIPNKVNPLTIKEICEIVGYNDNQSARFEKEMYELRLYDQRVIIGIKNEFGIWFKTNPRLHYGGTSGHLEEFIKLLGNDFSIAKTEK